MLSELMKLAHSSILFALILLFSSTSAYCQTGKHGHPQPVIRHSSNSILPDTIAITGKIIAISPGYCGYFCLGGTVKIKLTEAIIGYNSRYAFVVTACLQEADTSRIVTVKASKLKQKEKECYYISIANDINSQAIPSSEGVPFYKLSERETHKLELDDFRRK
jgi:hypothetical protein